jgi:hypothetical protein
MSERTISAAFFMARDGEAGDALEAMAARAGVTGARRGEGSTYERAHLRGRWAGLGAVVGATRLAAHDCLRIELREADFLAQRPLELPPELALAADPSLTLAEAFRDACLALPAEAGAVLSLPQHNDPRAIAELYRDVLGANPDALVRAAVGLLYLDERLGRGTVVPPGRDTLPVPRGLAVFAGHGRSRWY